MKKTLKIIGCIFLGLIVLGNISRAIVKTKYENSFEAQIARANRNCPIPVANGVGQVTSIKLEDKFLTYHIDYAPGHCNIDAYKHNPSATRDMFYLTFMSLNAQGNGSDKLLDQLVSKGYGLKIVATSGSDSFVSELAPPYIKSMKARIISNPSEALHDALTLKLYTESGELPMTIEEGMTITKMSLEGRNIVITVEMDENLYDVDLLRDASEDMAQSLMDEANNGDPEIGAFLDLCKVSHSGLTYRYKGNQTGKYADVNLSSDMILSQRTTPRHLNIH